MADDIVTEPVADEIVARLRQMATHVWGDPLRRHYAGCEYWHLECAALTVCDEIERLRSAIDTVFAAIDDEGIAPHYHRTVMEHHRHQWPTLWRAIDALLEARRG